MPNAKLKCSVCQCYWPRTSFYAKGVCSLDCYREKLRARARRKRESRAARYGTASLSYNIRARVRKRDHQRCRWCSDPNNLQVHHINYRSQGGPDEDWNLITLCDECHRRAHSNKRTWQPILRGVMWKHYVDGEFLTVAQFARWNGLAA